MRTLLLSSIASRSSFLGFCLFGLAVPVGLGACGGSAHHSGDPPAVGQTDFLSAAPPGGNAFGAGAQDNAAGAATSGPTAASSGTTRTVQETDLYRLDGNRLYYLNAYRGLMVFDLTDVDHPKFLGRSPIVGTPVQMYVQNGIAVVVVADWYGSLVDGTPFHGSIVRGLDANDPSNIKVLGEAKLGGWVQDLRVVGDVLYAVSEDYGWVYGWEDVGVANGGVVSQTTTGPSVIVSSVNFAGGHIAQVSSKTYAGYSGVFNVTPSSIMLAHPAAPADPTQGSTSTELRYLDISDPGGTIAERGALTVDGVVQGWGADNGRWNLDFADGKTAHTIGCAGGDCYNKGYVLATADFTNPDAPALASELSIASTGWSAAARFDSGRMYLSPDNGYVAGGSTPLQIYDLSNPAAPHLAGSTQITGSVWLMIPSGQQLFALGSNYTGSSSQVALQYLDVTNPSAPSLLGTSTFGGDWAWTPAAGTFKAFTKDDTKGLVVLPFSGWSQSSQQYNNGVQLIEFTPTTLTTAGAAHTRGWVERGILANGRIVSLSDLALSVVDYTNPMSPQVTAELTLARNVIGSQPLGSTIAEVSSDWWGNDVTQSEVRVLPASDPGEIHDQTGAPGVTVPGINGNVFTNGSLVYVVTSVQVPAPCQGDTGSPKPGGGGTCYAWQQTVQVVDASNGTARARGSVALPMGPSSYGGWGWYGYYYYDWYGGSDIVQVGKDALAFRRWTPTFDPSGRYVDSLDSLFVVDLSNPDAPAVGSTVITQDLTGWWGNMRVIGDTLYTTHYVWQETPLQPNAPVRYYVDRIDLTDRAHPRVEASVNVPGLLVGGSATDPSVLYTVDYRWYTLGGATTEVNDFDVVRLDSSGLAHLVGTTALDGWVGNVVVRGTTAYTSTQAYQPTTGQSLMELHQIDVSDPAHPRDYTSSTAKGWGWLLDVQGDRALVTSGWGAGGIDIYKVTPGSPPTYDQFVRTVGWGWVSNAARQDNTLFLTLGSYGVQAVDLQ
jgi:hypothetical protein